MNDMGYVSDRLAGIMQVSDLVRHIESFELTDEERASLASAATKEEAQQKFPELSAKATEIWSRAVRMLENGEVEMLHPLHPSYPWPHQIRRAQNPDLESLIPRLENFSGWDNDEERAAAEYIRDQLDLVSELEPEPDQVAYLMTTPAKDWPKEVQNLLSELIDGQTFDMNVPQSQRSR
jgi:hypothetical protein